MTNTADTIRISMWSGPRNISTAMMRSFASRPECRAVDEPFYAYYLARTGLHHPMYKEVIASQPTNWRTVADNLNAPLPKGSSLYIKHMTHHMLEEVDLGVFRKHRNVFLIRDPKRAIASYAAKWDQISTEDIGIKRQLEIFEEIRNLANRPPLVVEAEDILKNPETSLKKLCTALDIEWQAEMLRWPKGRRPEDGVWAAHWYASVEASTGFAPYEDREITLSLAQSELLEEQLPYYNTLRSYKI
ncbi:MAG: sulfotransferase [Sneathiella sp.]